MSLYVRLADRLRSLEPRLRDQAYRLGALDELRTLADEVEALECANKARQQIIDGQAKLLACYRAGTQRGASVALDMIERGKRQLARLEGGEAE